MHCQQLGVQLGGAGSYRPRLLHIVAGECGLATVVLGSEPRRVALASGLLNTPMHHG